MPLKSLVLVQYFMLCFAVYQCNSENGSVPDATDYLYLNSGNDSIEDIGSGYDDDYGDYAYDTENGDDDVATTEEASYEDYFPTYDETDEEWNGFDGFVCPDGTRLGKSKICDGMRDCYDCSDESNCTQGKQKFFYCYHAGNTEESSEKQYTSYDPKCIAHHEFCDGVTDCKNGEDEASFGPGFKCTIRDRHRSCILPQHMICDGVPDCEDRSDSCQDGKLLAEGNETMDDATNEQTSIPPRLFQCLSSSDRFSGRQLISIKQVCDGIFDCSDLSDECLCQTASSENVKNVCGGICTQKIWRNQDENENCKRCDVGQVLWKPDNGEGTCYNTSVIPTLLRKIQFQRLNGRSLPLSNKFIPSDVIECLDQTLMKSIRAKKCDGRPECYFGIDECGIGCNKNQLLNATEGGSGEIEEDPAFCSFLVNDMYEYSCKSYQPDFDKDAVNSLTAMKQIVRNPLFNIFCDGTVHCIDGADEKFCPRRRNCTGSKHKSETYDISQECDGYQHCSNGADERGDLCASGSETFSCGKNFGDSSPAKSFAAWQLLDGKMDCDTGADECPPFLSKMEDIKKSYASRFDDVSDTPKFDSGISSHDRAINNVPLQIFLVAASFIGLSALAVSLILVFYNLTVTWRRFVSNDSISKQTWICRLFIFLREAVVILNITISKALICSYFAYIKITRSEDSNYSVLDLRWRSSRACGIIGSVCFVGTQIPIITLACFATSYAISTATCCHLPTRINSKSLHGNGKIVNQPSKDYRHSRAMAPRTRIYIKLLMVLVGLFLLLLTWIPPLLFARLTTLPTVFRSATETYAWAIVDTAPVLLKANLLDQAQAAKFASLAYTLTDPNNITSISLPLNSDISFSEFRDVINSRTPLEIRLMGSYGYYSQSGACVPAFLTHAVSGQTPHDMAISNTVTWSLSLFIILFDFILVIYTIALTMRYGESHIRYPCCTGKMTNEKGRHKSKVLNSTFIHLLLVESLTWISIALLYVLKQAIPECISVYSYTVWCLVALGVNCGILTPFLLLKRKFRIGNELSSYLEKPNESTRIIEATAVDEIEENEPLRNQTKERRNSLDIQQED